MSFIDKRLFVEHPCILSDIYVCILWFPNHNVSNYYHNDNCNLDSNALTSSSLYELYKTMSAFSIVLSK